MDEQAVARQLSATLPQGQRICCKDTIQQIRPAAEAAFGRELPEDWASCCYWAAVHMAFPHRTENYSDLTLDEPAKFTLRILQQLLDEERQRLPYDPFWDFAFPRDDGSNPEYTRFRQAWREEFVYEMLRLCDELMPYTTLAHISSVHHVAMLAANGLKKGGQSIDCLLVSAAAAVHDVGKFGCRPGERVPYLHYYYTHRWCARLGLGLVGQIAANHSTWDLELENMPGESLCVIYADFRSKQKTVNGKPVTVIYTLKESFDVILSKLDNVDTAKEHRYKIVYTRLHDFEDFLRSLGTDVDEVGEDTPIKMPDVELQNSNQLVQSLVYRALGADLRLMSVMTDDLAFDNLLEAARSESDWKQLRAYLDVFKEFSTYLQTFKKRQLIDFLYELLSHREGDIRHYAAEILGITLANYNAGYRKSLPDDVVDSARDKLMNLWRRNLLRIVQPDHKLAPQHISRIGYTLKIVVASLQEHAGAEDFAGFRNVLLECYDDPNRWTNGGRLVLLDVMYDLSLQDVAPETLQKILAFASTLLMVESERVRTAAGRCLYKLSAQLPKDSAEAAALLELVSETAPNEQAAPRYLQMHIMENLGADVSDKRKALQDPETMRKIFLENLRTGTPWILIAVNIDILSEFALLESGEDRLHIATHLCNLLKVSEFIGIRKAAGNTLLRIAPLLSNDQRNEVAIELLKALETGDYTFSKYIPPYLGQLTLMLPDSQVEEISTALQSDLAHPNECIVNVALDTIEEMLAGSYAAEAKDEAAQDLQRRRLMGMLLTGLAHYQETVRQNALLLLGKLFDQRQLRDDAKKHLLGLSLQKTLALMEENPTRLTDFHSTAALTHIWRFLTLHRVDLGDIVLPQRKRIAFFPGTFDPFTLSHKGIVRCIREMGFEVYLAVDEFSWSKNTQPHLMRRRIIAMSVADLFHVHLFPDEIPVNIANPVDLDRLAKVFEGKELYLVAGSDVVKNASAYHANNAKPGSVLERNHILFCRAGEHADIGSIKGEVLELQLPAHLEQISSTLIRENVDANLDISAMTDPLVQEFIYQRGLYLGEPRFKPMQTTFPVSIAAEDGRLVLRKENMVVGTLSSKVLSSGNYFSALQNLELADYLRSTGCITTLWLERINVQEPGAVTDACHFMMIEAILRGIRDGCRYAICRPNNEAERDALRRIGFTPLVAAHNWWGVGLSHPLIMMQNLLTTIKEPFASDARVQQTLNEINLRMQTTMSKLYPGEAVITLSMPMVLQKIVDSITDMNGVPNRPTNPRVLGPLMVVPFGKILRGSLVPNTVTHTLRTDRVWEPDLRSSTIEPFPGYNSLTSQLRTIRSFNRPIVLVDDILNRSVRLKTVLPLLKQEGVQVHKVLLGVLSEYGRDGMQGTGIPVDGIYNVPSLRQWFLQSTLFPFIGGDAVRRENRSMNGMEPVINKIFPYAEPTLPECDYARMQMFSRCVLECARDLFKTLEQVYSKRYGRSLTLSRLNEVIVLPVLPDRGGFEYDLNKVTTVYLERDLEQLNRAYTK